MATPMRSTDFRSVVEPIMNEVFDGVLYGPAGNPLLNAGSTINGQAFPPAAPNWCRWTTA